MPPQLLCCGGFLKEIIVNQFQFQPFGWPSFLFIPPLPPSMPFTRCPPPTYIDDSDISISVGPPGPPGPPGPLEIPVKIVATTPYTAISDDYYLGIDVASASSIVLPISIDGKTYIIKDVSGNASDNPITVTANTTIDNASSYVIDSDYGSITLVFNGIEWSIV